MVTGASNYITSEYEKTNVIAITWYFFRTHDKYHLIFNDKLLQKHQLSASGSLVTNGLAVWGFSRNKQVDIQQK